jgi:hypothetical protein
MVQLPTLGATAHALACALNKKGQAADTDATGNL